nr:hypothetical protein [uncultured archaeon]
MNQIGISTIGLQMRERRVAYWEKYHNLPGCREMVDYFDKDLATI